MAQIPINIVPSSLIDASSTSQVRLDRLTIGSVICARDKPSTDCISPQTCALRPITELTERGLPAFLPGWCFIGCCAHGSG
jgi:hypothetical protein